jgi:putative alpha-1,2-mannosidase
MAGSKETLGPWSPGPFYWQGNEHDIHAPYLFAIAGRPDLTQQWVRWILDTQHANNHVGLDGNDDGGTLSAWYVWSALGLYPVAGTDKYVLGTPLFPEATVRLRGDRRLRILAENYAADRYLVEQVRLNGEVVTGPYVTHGELVGDKAVRESVLRFVMKD